MGGTLGFHEKTFGSSVVKLSSSRQRGDILVFFETTFREDFFKVLFMSSMIRPAVRRRSGH